MDANGKAVAVLGHAADYTRIAAVQIAGNERQREAVLMRGKLLQDLAVIEKTIVLEQKRVIHNYASGRKWVMPASRTKDRPKSKGDREGFGIKVTCDTRWDEWVVQVDSWALAEQILVMRMIRAGNEQWA